MAYPWRLRNPFSFFCLLIITANPFLRAKATVMAGSELLWQETQPRFLNTGLATGLDQRQILFTAASTVERHSRAWAALP